MDLQPTAPLAAVSAPATKTQTALPLRPFLAKLVRREDLDRSEAFALLNALLAEGSTDVEIAAVLTALAQKGESAAELAGMCDAMCERMVRLRCDLPRVIDTAGTGASAVKTFNVSTAAAFVIAAAGLPVAKHGARAATSNSGSADVLQALGCDVAIAPEVAERQLNEHSLCFLFAPHYHPAAARVAPIRRQLGFRTVFNLIGPLSSPSRTPLQLIGVCDEVTLRRMAEALSHLGGRRGFVVNGEDGLDEISLAAPTRVAEVRDGAFAMVTVAPEDFGVDRAPYSHLHAGSPQASAEIVLSVLNGTADRCAADLVILNAAAALMVGLGVNAMDGADLARKALKSGAALAKLDAVRDPSKGRRA